MLDIGRGAVGQTGHNRAASEDIGISCEQDGGHRATGRQPGDKHTCRIDLMIGIGKGEHAAKRRAGAAR